MPFAALPPARSWYHLLHAAPLRPLHTLMRTTGERWRPSPPAESAAAGPAAAALLAAGAAEARQLAGIRRESGRGRVPTIVLGGFVPDSGEQVFLLRTSLLQAGDLYAVTYPRDGFSLELLCAQLDDLAASLARRNETPVLFGVSFGAGVLLEWLRRRRAAGTELPIAGLVLVSPVTCVADVVPPGAVKPATLIGRALRPILEAAGAPSEPAVERARLIFTRMFEAGAQNKAALARLMTAEELGRLHGAVLGTIRGLTARGAAERVGAFGAMRAPTEYFSPAALPLSSAPALVLFAEREDAIMDPAAPSLLAFGRAVAAYFPEGAALEVRARPGDSPVQHASLVFHAHEFLPPLRAFYGRLRAPALPLAA